MGQGALNWTVPVKPVHMVNNSCLDLFFCREIPAQVEALVKAMKENKVGSSHHLCKSNSACNYVLMMFFMPMQGVNFENDWKLVTIYVGTSDLCEYCNNQVSE